MNVMGVQELVPETDGDCDDDGVMGFDDCDDFDASVTVTTLTDPECDGFYPISTA